MIQAFGVDGGLTRWGSKGTLTTPEMAHLALMKPLQVPQLSLLVYITQSSPSVLFSHQVKNFERNGTRW